MKTGDELRDIFLSFFRDRGHRVVDSSSLVPADDPTLLFTNAGMVQFKRVFLGEDLRDYTRASTSQKCVRAGGKHNDLENVGYTARHHTFFEMLGNFSFGDYFKKEAIAYAWELLTDVLKLPADKLYASVYEKDDEAYAIWRDQVGVPVARIVRLGEKDNFWAMGDTGPCGPCSEILIDRGAEFGCNSPDCKPGCDCDRYLEIWNLVFMQYNRDAQGVLTSLPKPSIDTGMGLERIASVLQNTHTNFETDLFAPIMDAITRLSGKKLGDGKDTDVCMKVIADHSRAAAFLVGDGVIPSNEGKGYVLRRIMRRAIRYGRQLGLTRPFLHETAAAVCRAMEKPYPELLKSLTFITSVIENEENRFRETLDNGLTLLAETLAEMEKKGQRTIPGEVIFKLYDTFGFPVDVVKDVVRGRDLLVDEEGFAHAMERQRERSRKTVSFAGAADAVKALSGRGVKSEFVGYNNLSVPARVIAVIKDGQEVESAGEGEAIQVVTDRTPFYGEAGGQAGDSGTISADGLAVDVVRAVKDPTGLILHEARVASGALSKGKTVTLSVSEEKRRDTARNHSATHLLHAALRQVLGEHAKQAGSLVAADRLRFDFTHFSALGRDEIAEICRIVNARVRENVPVCVEEMDAKSARETGAMALFEEKYGDTVRVVTMGGFSSELCGGTHTDRTGDIGFFWILSEQGVASGVRRIEAVTGAEAVACAQAMSDTLDRAAAFFKDRAENVPDKVEKALAQVRAQEKEIANLKAKLAAKASESAADEVREVKGIKVLATTAEADSPQSLRDAADRFRDRIGSGVVVLAAENGGKVMFIAMVTKDLLGKKLHAGNIVKKVAQKAGGGGGGRPDMAQAGGSDPAKIPEALAAAYEAVEEMVG
ncbi:MAG: alanine--tRNA ligase [Thermodesulfobacteriota bacterium]